MGIKASWDNEDHTILRFNYEGSWTWDDLHNALSQGHAMMRTETHTVDVLIDVSQSRLIPSGALARGKHIDDIKPDNHGMTAVVGANTFMQGLYDLFRKIYRKNLNVVYVPTLEEARAKIAEQRKPQEIGVKS
jgi:hypothetical protein